MSEKTGTIVPGGNLAAQDPGLYVVMLYEDGNQIQQLEFEDEAVAKAVLEAWKRGEYKLLNE